jgi:hypothetical protein
MIPGSSRPVIYAGLHVKDPLGSFEKSTMYIHVLVTTSVSSRHF